MTLELLGLGPEVKTGPRPCVFVEDGFWKHLPGLFSCPVDTQATEPLRLWGWQAQDVGESPRSQEGRGWSSWKPPPLGLQGTAVRRPAALWTEGSLPSGRARRALYRGQMDHIEPHLPCVLQLLKHLPRARDPPGTLRTSRTHFYQKFRETTHLH